MSESVVVRKAHRSAADAASANIMQADIRHGASARLLLCECPSCTGRVCSDRPALLKAAHPQLSLRCCCTLSSHCCCTLSSTAAAPSAVGPGIWYCLVLVSYCVRSLLLCPSPAAHHNPLPNKTTPSHPISCPVPRQGLPALLPLPQQLAQVWALVEARVSCCPCCHACPPLYAAGPGPAAGRPGCACGSGAAGGGCCGGCRGVSYGGCWSHPRLCGSLRCACGRLLRRACGCGAGRLQSCVCGPGSDVRPLLTPLLPHHPCRHRLGLAASC
jgi:hypothetical protein